MILDNLPRAYRLWWKLDQSLEGLTYALRHLHCGEFPDAHWYLSAWGFTAVDVDFDAQEAPKRERRLPNLANGSNSQPSLFEAAQ